MRKIDIAVVDYGMGNLRSVSKALEHVAPEKSVLVTSCPDEISKAERVVFPGQGAMPDCIRELDARGLRESVLFAAHNKPFLGICIGLQMLFEHSEEGDAAGLGVFQGQVKRFAAADMHDEHGEKLKVPQGIESGTRFYYVHSYYVAPADQVITTGYTRYPSEFTSAIAQNNLFAVQFHPEKSATAGLQLLHNFVNWQP